MNKKLTIEDVQKACEKWKNSFNNGDAQGCASCYDLDAFMEAKPLGNFQGREQIFGFWDNIIKQGFADVQYIDPKITIIDDKSAILSSQWSMNNTKGIITKELWVLNDKQEVLLKEDYFEIQG